MLARFSILTVVWHIWRERNNMIFNGKEKGKRVIMCEIQFGAKTLYTRKPREEMEN